uniref:Uncharacterized protein n=1 Tax=Arundo donax TaxID=35708 RepID=A0A0A9A0Y2_ARUDO
MGFSETLVHKTWGYVTQTTKPGFMSQGP